MTILAVDVDRTLTRGVAFTKDQCLKAKPNRPMINWVNAVFEDGDTEVVIYTARKNELRWSTKLWLKKHGVKYHRFGPRKMIYDWFIDDHAFWPEL